MKKFLPTQIVISYFTANKKDWVKVIYTPYDSIYVLRIKTTPTAHYDREEKAWCCEAKYGEKVEKIVKESFPDIPIDIQEHRGKDLYAEE